MSWMRCIYEATEKELGEKNEFASMTVHSWVILVLPFCIFQHFTECRCLDYAYSLTTTKANGLLMLQAMHRVWKVHWECQFKVQLHTCMTLSSQGYRKYSLLLQVCTNLSMPPWLTLCTAKCRLCPCLLHWMEGTRVTHFARLADSQRLKIKRRGENVTLLQCSAEDQELWFAFSLFACTENSSFFFILPSGPRKVVEPCSARYELP